MGDRAAIVGLSQYIEQGNVFNAYNSNLRYTDPVELTVLSAKIGDALLPQRSQGQRSAGHQLSAGLRELPRRPDQLSGRQRALEQSADRPKSRGRAQLPGLQGQRPGRDPPLQQRRRSPRSPTAPATRSCSARAPTASSTTPTRRGSTGGWPAITATPSRTRCTRPTRAHGRQRPLRNYDYPESDLPHVGARATIPAAVNFAFCDGSVRFVKDRSTRGPWTPANQDAPINVVQTVLSPPYATFASSLARRSASTRPSPRSPAARSSAPDAY